jgi:glycosyltransferase involved in cell wall biosynthesis
LNGPKKLLAATRKFRPDIIQAWGHTAQLAALAVRARCNWSPKILWSPPDTIALPRDAGVIDQQKFKLTLKYAARADQIVFTSEVAAAAHRRAGFPNSATAVVPLAIDPTRFKPDFASRRKVREQFEIPPTAFVVGMIAPFQTEYGHGDFFKGIGELIKSNPNLYVVLAGHGIQRGNSALMQVVGGGLLGTRTHLLGEWSDIASLYNACDVACSTALNDESRMNLVMAMLCGTPCVATGIGAQGELLGKFGVSIEPGSPQGVVRGITKILQLTEDRRLFMAQSARKHALDNFVFAQTLQRYLQMYFDLAGIKASAVEEIPAPVIDPTIPPPPSDWKVPTKPKKPKLVVLETVETKEIIDHQALESHAIRGPQIPVKVQQTIAAELANHGEVLEKFESGHALMGQSADAKMAERARGVAEDLGDLLAPEEWQSAAAAEAAPAAATAKVVQPVEPAVVSVPTVKPIPIAAPSPVAMSEVKSAD